MPKKQKVRFHKGDRKPKSDKEYDQLSYKVKMKKRGRIQLMYTGRIGMLLGSFVHVIPRFQ